MHLYTFFLFYSIVRCVFSKNIDIKAGVHTPIPWSVGLRFFTEVKNNAGEDYSVEVHPQRCCMENESKCDVLSIMGSANDIISGGASKTLTMVAPLLDLYKRKGTCTLYVDSGPVARPKNMKRDIVKVKFNTKVMKNDDQFKSCNHIDEDPMNNCNPVDCDIYYNGKMSYFSNVKKRCVEIPICVSHNSKVPYLAYNPTTNKCVHAPTVTKQDLSYIKQLTKDGVHRFPKHVTIIQITPEGSVKDDEYNMGMTEEDPQDIYKNDERSNVTKKKKGKSKNKLTAKTNRLISKLTGEVYDSERKLKDNKTQGPSNSVVIHTLIRYCLSNKYAMVFIIGIFFIQCCLICTLLYCVTKNCCCFKKKHIINKFFNHRQDISVTTPLICTSNVDTDTTDYQYLSESSNYIDKKIKCYKACQKERINNAKLSMSDDILSKCITRRDWHILPKSEKISEINDDSTIIREASVSQKKVKDMKVNFQEGYQEKQTKNIKSIVKKESKLKQDRLSDSSEQEIQCHNYNFNNCNLTELKKQSNVRNIDIYNHENKMASGAQVYFSKDSIDEYMSERGLMFIGDDASRYSITSISSAAKSSVSSRSSKTSKNNIVKNVLTLLSRKRKRPSSDSGIEKINPNLDLELLHLSRATVYSSSNETDEKEMKKSKASTSSL